MKARNILALVTSSSQARIRGIARYAKSHDWNLMLENQLAHGPKGWCGDGALVTMKGTPSLLSYVRRLVARGVPVVNLTGSFVPESLPSVVGDNVRIGELAAEHFADRAFRHVAWFSTNWNRIQQQRAAAFSAAWKVRYPQTAPPLRFVWSENSSARVRDDWTRQSHWLAERLAQAPKPLAVFCYSDYDASHVLGICREAGIDVPHEVAILGVDNNTVICENQSVPISSVNHDLERVGYEGAALLDRLMAGSCAQGDKPPAILIPPRGVITRRSTETTAIADPTLRAAMQLIENRLSHPLGAAQIANDLGISRIRLDRLFARELGISVGHEILRQRLIRVKYLLSGTDLSLMEIAHRTGFCNSGYLVNVFRRETGVTPGTFRREMNGDSSELNTRSARRQR